MVKKLGVKFLVLAMICVMAASDVLAQTSRIRFARGRSSASVSGTMASEGSRTYILGARRGQTLTAVLSCGNGDCDFAQGNMHDTSYSEYVESNGDVYITIHNHGGRTTRFTLTVSIQ